MRTPRGGTYPVAFRSEEASWGSEYSSPSTRRFSRRAASTHSAADQAVARNCSRRTNTARSARLRRVSSTIRAASQPSVAMRPSTSRRAAPRRARAGDLSPSASVFRSIGGGRVERQLDFGGGAEAFQGEAEALAQRAAETFPAILGRLKRLAMATAVEVRPKSALGVACAYMLSARRARGPGQTRLENKPSAPPQSQRRGSF